MIHYVLDTDIWSLYGKGHPIVQARVHAHPIEELALAIITVEEQLSGWYAKVRQARQRIDKARQYQHLADAVMALKDWQILSFSEPALNRFEQLYASKLNVGKKDLCIAAIALEHSATVVTRNLRDFQRIPGLTVEDWSV